MNYVTAVWTFLVAHKIEALVILWIVMNIAWAQLPQPKNPTIAKLWNALHAILQLVVTPAAASGTFKLPWLLDVIVKAMLSSPTTPGEPKQVTVGKNEQKLTAKNAGDGDGNGTS